MTSCSQCGPAKHPWNDTLFLNKFTRITNKFIFGRVEEALDNMSTFNPLVLNFFSNISLRSSALIIVLDIQTSHLGANSSKMKPWYESEIHSAVQLNLGNSREYIHITGKTREWYVLFPWYIRYRLNIQHVYSVSNPIC